MRVLTEEPRMKFGVNTIGFRRIRKRDGRTVPFDPEKIFVAILRAGLDAGDLNDSCARLLTQRAVRVASATFARQTPTSEQIHDVVANVLLASPYRQTAKAFLFHRADRLRSRQVEQLVDPDRLGPAPRATPSGPTDSSEVPVLLQGLQRYVSTNGTLRF